MAIEIFVEPSTPPMSWDEFQKAKSPFSIALDGYVWGGPKYTSNGPYANFNHHEEVSRFETRATCAQVLLALRVGLLKTFSMDRKPHCNIFVNDCDQDVCTAIFLLKHHWRTGAGISSRLEKLIEMEDMFDTCAGAYPYPKDDPILEELAWIYYPYSMFRLNGGLDKRDAQQFKSIITDVEARILKFINGENERLPLQMDYEVLADGIGWKLVSEKGADARTAMLSDGVSAFVSVRERNPNRWTYTIGRLSPYIQFDVPLIMNHLNEYEGCKADRWGGGVTIGGSPRIEGSQIPPNTLVEIINEVIQPKQ